MIFNMELKTIILMGIYIGISIAVRITLSIVRKTLVMGDYTDDNEEYTFGSVQIISESSNKGEI